MNLEEKALQFASKALLSLGCSLQYWGSILGGALASVRAFPLCTLVFSGVDFYFYCESVGSWSRRDD